ncbi:MAG: peptide deformylase [Candidatus Obscuribacterales bacterium]|nr:peptide deformylase [Candidatus Obscuribacterales bacterium]
MAILPVLTYPDKRLKLPSLEVDRHDPELPVLIADLIETMNSSPGCIGLAAPQCDIHKRVLVVDVSRNPNMKQKLGLVILVNPIIIAQSGKNTAREGCLSIPHLIANVTRAKRISLTATNQEGTEVIIDASGFEARAILHEIDHLDGILFLDRVSLLKTDVFRRKRYLNADNEDTEA